MKHCALLVLASVCLVMSAPADKIDWTPKTDNSPSVRLEGEGNAQKHEGAHIRLDGDRRIYQSDNGNHEVYVGGTYEQHLGGPSGNSQPSWEARTGYSYHFKG